MSNTTGPKGLSTTSRVLRTKSQTRKYYNSLSKWYDFLAGSSERRYIDIGVQMTGAKRNDTVLDIGFGTGNALMTLARTVGESGHTYGIDISDGMCRVASSKVEKACLSYRVLLSCADGVALPFLDESFNAVFMSFSLELFDAPEIPIVLNECKRVLKIGGRVGVVGLSKRGSRNLMTRIYEWAGKRFPKYIDCRLIPIRAYVEDAGFQIVGSSEQSMWMLPVEIVVGRRA